ncbi:hypothetical protein DDZ18_03310 [Marinicauda salina]|uniref:Uncharacterized protein n=1 Tax=Marinicauda salina TaxID=2135793 RepID=A0A2U2BXB9_9PROT|nr:tetratricopeptide repeat protein [Marinicauda salina]PWE18640.1 hypothetical protein DDZ18_03310 [Marinicauda salina]
MIRLLVLCTFALAAASAAAQPVDQRRAVCPAGYDALEAEDPAGAIEAFRDCLAAREYEWTVEAELRARLGAAHLALGEADAALLAYNQILGLVENNGGDENNPLVRRNRAVAFLQLERYEDALDDLEIAARRTPEDPFVRTLLGSALLDLERHAEAAEAFDAAVRLAPDVATGWIGRSAAFIELGLTDRAVEDGREAVAIAPENPGALNALCWALVQAERASEGLDICRAAVEADPESGAIVHSLAAALEQTGETGEARDLYARAHELAPDDPEITEDYERVHGG